MKREGRQHGTVRGLIKAKMDAADMAMVGYTKAPTKPTNHSKHTGKCKKARCVQCHSHPVSKSKDKAKGTHKLKSGDVVLNHRLVSWRVIADRNAHWSKYSGVSATGVLDALLTDSCWSQGDDQPEDQDLDQYGYGYGFDHEYTSDLVTDECRDDAEGSSSSHGIEEEGDDADEEENMGFCEVGFVWDCLNEEGWCVVDEM